MFPSARLHLGNVHTTAVVLQVDSFTDLLRGSGERSGNSRNRRG